MIREAEKPKEEPKQEVRLPMDLQPKAPEPPKEVKEDEPRFYVELYVEHNLEEMKILSKYLKDNGYKYIVRNQGNVK